MKPFMKKDGTVEKPNVQRITNISEIKKLYKKLYIAGVIS